MIAPNTSGLDGLGSTIANGGGRARIGRIGRLNFDSALVTEGLLDGVHDDLCGQLWFEAWCVHFAHGAVKPHGLCRSGGDEFGLEVADDTRAWQGGGGPGQDLGLHVFGVLIGVHVASSFAVVDDFSKQEIVCREFSLGSQSFQGNYFDRQGWFYAGALEVIHERVAQNNAVVEFLPCTDFGQMMLKRPRIDDLKSHSLKPGGRGGFIAVEHFFETGVVQAEVALGVEGDDRD